MSVKIIQISKKSLFKKYDVSKGDVILSVNNRALHNFEGLIYELENDILSIRIKNKNGIIIEKKIKREYFDNIKMQFEEIPIKHCNNKCIFCFIDQNPPELRKSLYFKDDDYRLSLEYGNFITLNNIKKEEIRDIIEHKFSPLYVSIHAVSKDIRDIIFGRDNKGLDVLKILLKNGIKVHGQIVIVKGLNDAHELKKTMLFAYKYKLLSLGIVPSGLTKFRKKLYTIEHINSEDAKRIINTVEEFKSKKGINNIYVADEFFINANYEIPSMKYYNDFEQIENGVGMTRQFLNQTKAFNKLPLKHNCMILTGKLFGRFLKMNNYFDNMIIDVYNNFFGKSINVAGLLSGKDIIRALSNTKAKRILISGEIFNQQGLTIDNMCIEYIKKQTNKDIVCINNYCELKEFICQ